MRRSYKDSRAPLAGFLEDQAAVADGLLSLYEATFDPRWLDEVRDLVREMLAAFWDEDAAAFFDTAKDQEQLVVRPQDVTDNAIPSGTSLAVDVLLRAGLLLGEPSWTDRARLTLERLAPTAAKAPLAFGRLLAALDFHLGRVVELADRVDIYEHSQHPYTKALLSSIPVPDPLVERDREPLLIKGEIPSPVNPPSGCRFHTRCPIARVPGICSEVEPELEPHGHRDQEAACHFAGEA